MNEPARLRLRDVTLEGADTLDAWSADPSNVGGFNDLGESQGPIDREALARGPLRNKRNGILIIELVEDARPIGSIGWHRASYGPGGRSDAWNIGIELVPDARGHGYGAEAQALVARYLFEHTAVNRVEAQTDIENVAEQRALERAGFVREGILRGSQFRAGAYHDLVSYSILRGDVRT